jgi:biotin carboxyl carrier protein
MDVTRNNSETTTFKRKAPILISAIALLGLIIWLLTQPVAGNKVSRENIWTAQVQQGSLLLKVDGFGKLKSKVQRLLTAPTNALVEEIVLRPGALVTADSIIVLLSNPEVEQDVRDAKRELANRKAQYRQLVIQQQRELLSQKAANADLNSRIELAKVRVEAETALHKRGIVSLLDFKRSTTELKQLEQRLAIEQMRIEQLAAGHKESLAIQQDKIAQQNEQLVVISDRFERLTVRAGMEGVLQQLPVEIGQNVAIGEKVALVGSMKKLMAHLQVPQTLVQQLAIGQQVELDTRSGKTTGNVNRIVPIIQQGNVLVEVNITGALPENARPELTIDGVIHTGELKDTLYLKKPVGARPSSNMKLFRLTEESRALAANIRLGVEAGEFIQIIAGATRGDSFILSDMSRWQDQTQLSIKD